MLAYNTTGKPQFGHDEAKADTSFPQLGHSAKAIVAAPTANVLSAMAVLGGLVLHLCDVGGGNIRGNAAWHIGDAVG